MSFLEKEETKQSTFWDWVVGIGLIVVVGGFTVYYQYQKRSSLSRFQQAEALYKAGNIKDAGKMYEELKSAQYLTTADDSTIYARLDTVETAREQLTQAVTQAKAKAAAGDTANIHQAVNGLRYPELLSDEDKAWVDSVKSKSAVAAKP
jgi:predicted negative regulator of RcsB-dependent stress response